MPNIGPVALKEILEEFVEELDDREATELATVEAWTEELRTHMSNRVRAGSRINDQTGGRHCARLAATCRRDRIWVPNCHDG
jgi:hypothetical protein